MPVQVWHYEIWSPLTQIDHVIDISSVIGEKLSAIRAYPSQNSIMRFDQAFRGLARYRGEMHSWPGGPYAEVFSA
jgi:LmbE family N-acetylglucosaminyl deacetylase